MARSTRPTARFLLVCLAGTALVVLPGSSALAAGAFGDDDGNQHEGYIEAIVVEGITGGCAVSPPRYCPEQDVRRDQMASFLARALELPPASRDYFADDAGNTHEDNINRVAEAGITVGSGTGQYVPAVSVRRDQMASFLRRALSLPAASRDYFSDDNGNRHEDSINRLAEAGIALGDGAGSYSPARGVRRDQMASFLGRALGLSPRTPGGTFGSGTKRVGSDVYAGTYRSSGADGECYWERLRGFSGEFEDVIANGSTFDRTVVTIRDTDEGFDSARCGTWSDDLSAITSSPTDPFGGGTFIVGTDIAADTYRSGTVDSFCYWERLRGFTGEFEDLIADDQEQKQTVVTIKRGDVGFHSIGCGTWSNDLSPITESPTDPFGTGTFIVGTDIARGTWESSGGQACYWERLRGFSGEFEELIENGDSDEPTTVTIGEEDAGFSSSRCGTWTRVE